MSDEVIAIIELVKNGYDADARTVTVTLEHPGDQERASITVEDDGCGMSLETVLHAWLEPATGFKRRNGHKQRTARGRYPLGEKGVGRFAADKLGARVELVSRAAGSAEEVRLEVLWDAFLGGDYLDEVTSEWQVRQPTRFPGDAHGTVLRMTGLRATWDERRVARLQQGLSRMMAPSSSGSDFQILLQCAELPEYAGPVASPLLTGAPYRLVGRVTADGYFVADDESESIDLRRHAADQFRTSSGRLRTPDCGPFRLQLSVWDLDVLGVGGVRLTRPLRTLLRRSSGVSIYRDGFRVAPYGDPDEDWLELNQRRVNNPTLRVSTNQLIGTIEITQEANPFLRDRTSREGLVDAPAFEDLKALVVAALERLEVERYRLRKAVSPPAVPDGADPVLEHLRRAGGRGSGRALVEAVAAYKRVRAEAEQREKVLLRVAAAGAAAENLLTQLNGSVGALAGFLPTIQKRLPDLPATQRLTRQLQLASQQLDALQRLFDGRGGGRTRFDLRGLAQDALEIYAGAFEATRVEPRLVGTAQVHVTGDRGMVMHAVLHLVENALLAAAEERAPRWVQLEIASEPPALTVRDSGAGVPAAYREQVFDPFFTSREEAPGLGLYFARSLVRSEGYDLRLGQDGTGFVLDFSDSERSKSRTTQSVEYAAADTNISV